MRSSGRASLARGGSARSMRLVLLLNLFGSGLAALCATVLLATPAGAAAGAQLPPVSHADMLGRFSLTADPPEAAPPPEGALPVSAITVVPALGGYTEQEGVFFQNNSSAKPDYAGAIGAGPALAAKTQGPEVLIFHTHATEAYSDGAAYYLPKDSAYSGEDARNMVAIGEVVAERLRQAGIEVLHESAHCDQPSFNAAYTNSLQLMQEAKKQHPSLRLFVDLHRDSMITAQGVKYRPLVVLEGVETAQLMLVVGSPGKNAKHENWQGNLATAAALYRLMEQQSPGIMRPINISGNRYNQQVSTGALLVEVGSCGNTAEQAKAAARRLAGGIEALLRQEQA